MSRVVIVGGGITGLAAAYTLEKLSQEKGLPIEYTLLESSGRFGGKVLTDVHDGFVIEGGPDSFLTYKSGALELCNELGLEDELIWTNDANAGVYVLWKGRLQLLPVGMSMVAPARLKSFFASSLFSWPEKLRILWERRVSPGSEKDDESLGDFIRRRFGKAALYRLAEPLLASVHVADADRLSMRAAFPRLLALERQYGSFTKAIQAFISKGGASKKGSQLPPFVTLRKGLGSLVDSLVENLHGDLRLGQGVKELHLVSSQQLEIEVEMADGSLITADAVILTTPVSVAANLVEGSLPGLAQLLRRIRMESSAVVSLAYQADQIRHPMRGVGFVVPRTEPSGLMACTWTSSKFSDRVPEWAVLLRAFVGGSRVSDLLELDDKGLVSTVRKELHSIMGIDADPMFTHIYRWENLHPQYDVGHLERIGAIEKKCPGNLLLAGASYRGVGLPDCISQGQASASLALTRVEERRQEVTVKGEVR